MRRVSWRSLVAHKVRLILTVIAVVLGTAFVAGSFVFTDTLKHTFNGIFADADKGVDVRVDAKKASNPGVPLRLVDRIKAVPGVRAVQLEASAPLVLIGKNGKRVSSGGAPSEGTMWNPPGEQIKAPPTFVSGKAPSAPGDVVINEGAAKKSKLVVGDHTKVVLPARGIVDVTITGIYHTDTETGGYVGVEFTKQQALSLFTDGTHVGAVSIAGRGVDEKTLRDRVAPLLTRDLQAKTGDQVRKDDQGAVSKALSFVNYFLLAFGVIALIVGTFIIYNTFSMIIAQRVRELALLRAIGADRRQVRRSVLYEASVIGVVGSVLGLAGGVGLAYGLRALLDAMNVGLPSGALVLTPRTVIVAMIVGTVVTLVSAYAPARRAAKTPPVAAMREEFSSGPGSLAASLHRRRHPERRRPGCRDRRVSQHLGRHQHVADRPGTAGHRRGCPAARSGPVSLRHWRSRPGGCPSVRRGRAPGADEFGTQSAPNGRDGVCADRRPDARQRDRGYRRVNEIQYQCARRRQHPGRLHPLRHGRDARSAASRQAGGGGAGVKSMAELHPVLTTINGDDAEGTGVDGSISDVLKIDFKSGGGALTGQNMLVSNTTAQNKHWKLGDRVTLATPGGASVHETITGIYKDNQLLSSWLVSGDTYRKLTPSSRYADFVALVKAAPGTSASTLRAGLDDATNRYYTVDVKNRAEFKGQQASQINGLLGLLYGLLGLAIVIAIMGIINTLALSVVERRREIGMLRAVGMLRGQLRRTIYVESLLIAVFGALLGLALGLTFGALFTHRLRDQGLSVLTIPWGQAVTFLIIAAVVGVLAALWPGARAARTRPLAAIAEA